MKSVLMMAAGQFQQTNARKSMQLAKEIAEWSGHMPEEVKELLVYIARAQNGFL